VDVVGATVVIVAGADAGVDAAAVIGGGGDGGGAGEEIIPHANGATIAVDENRAGPMTPCGADTVLVCEPETGGSSSQSTCTEHADALSANAELGARSSAPAVDHACGTPGGRRGQMSGARIALRAQMDLMTRSSRGASFAEVDPQT